MSILRVFTKEKSNNYQGEEEVAERRVFKSPDKLESLSVFAVGDEILGGSLHNKEKDNKVSFSKGELLKFYVALKQARYPATKSFYSKHSSPITEDLFSVLNMDSDRLFLFKGSLFDTKLFSKGKFSSDCLTDDEDNFATEKCLQKQERIFARNIEYVEDEFGISKSKKYIEFAKDIKESKIKRKAQTDKYMEEYKQFLREFKLSIFISYNIFEREVMVNFLENLFYIYKLYN